MDHCVSSLRIRCLRIESNTGVSSARYAAWPTGTGRDGYGRLGRHRFAGFETNRQILGQSVAFHNIGFSYQPPPIASVRCSMASAWPPAASYSRITRSPEPSSANFTQSMIACQTRFPKILRIEYRNIANYRRIKLRCCVKSTGQTRVKYDGPLKIMRSDILFWIRKHR